MTHFDKRKLIGIALCHFISDVPIFLLPTLLPLLIRDIGLSYGDAGASMTVMMISMMAFQSTLGYFGASSKWRVSKPSMLLTGLIVVGIALFLVSLSSNFTQFVSLQFLVGLGMAFYHPIGYAMISEGYDSEDRGKAFGINESAGMAAAPIVFASTSLLLLLYDWRLIFYLWAVTAIFSAFVVRFSVKGKLVGKGGDIYRRTHESAWKIIKKMRGIIILMSLSEICVATITTFASTFLVLEDLSIGHANAITAMMMAAGVLGTIAVGSALDRHGERKVILAMMTTISIVSLIILNTTKIQYLILLMCILGLLLFGMGPPCYSLISKRMPEGQTAAYGILLSVAWGIGSLFPYLAGVLGDILGMKTIFVITAFAASSSIMVTYFWIESPTHSPVETHTKKNNLTDRPILTCRTILYIHTKTYPCDETNDDV